MDYLQISTSVPMCCTSHGAHGLHWVVQHVVHFSLWQRTPPGFADVFTLKSCIINRKETLASVFQ
jgi:hypothetical protein